ncbi:MAG TPA: phosphate ABC transporter substrate-binding protein PstS [Vicinamibacterales bacterium]
MKKTFALIGAVAVAAGATLTAQQINGAGATFPAPIYTKWFSEYNKLHKDVQINYQPLGSGAGVQQVSAKTVFFGASDFPLTDQQLAAAPGKLLHFPTVLGGVVPIYNVPGVTQELKFTGPVLAEIYMGKITKWNDPQIAKVNPGVTLPAADIAVVHRSEGSGTTFIWTDFLSKVSPDFKSKVGASPQPNWPTGVGQKGNDGVSGQVTQTAGAIGYVELIYALQNKISYGVLQNASGKFLKASIESVTAAASGAAKNMPPDFRVSITNAPGDDAYPASSFTWILLYQDSPDKVQGKTMVEFMKWALSATGGQQYAKDLGYAPLPKNVVDMELKELATIK